MTGQQPLRPWKWRGMAVIALLALSIDQASKWWYLSHPEWKRVILTDYFNLHLVYNRGISFGWYASDNIPAWIWIIPGLVLCAVLVIWSAFMPKSFRIAVGLITGGALGNMVDRLVHGAVVDFLDVHWREWHWPIFNVADVAITLGGGIVMYALLFNFEKKD